jgi:type I restriction enzyme S subunit
VRRPPIGTQRKIASALSAYDDLIENNSRRIKLLEEMAQRIYREWFVDFRYPGHEVVPMVDSELGLIPKGWSWKQLREIATEVRISVDPNTIDPGTPYVGLEHMPERSLAISEWSTAESAGSRKYQFLIGDVLFGKIRPYFHKVSVPPVAGICSTDAIVIRCRTPAAYGLVLSVVSSEAFVSEAVQSSQGTKMPRANWGLLEKYPVAMPPQELLERFNSIASETISLIHRMVNANRNLRFTCELLLPRLTSGEIDVTDLDIASVESAA